MTAKENQIVVYQPNETVRLNVRLENETVWLTQTQLCDLFGVVKSNISYHLKNIFGQVSWTTGQLFKKSNISTFGDIGIGDTSTSATFNGKKDGSK